MFRTFHTLVKIGDIFIALNYFDDFFTPVQGISIANADYYIMSFKCIGFCW